MMNVTIRHGMEISLINAANVFVQRVSEKLRSGNYPHSGGDGRGLKPIEDTIVVNAPEGDESRMSITITMGGTDAPYARAYEFGSGLHSELGGAGKYPIAPREQPRLVFFWEREGRMFFGKPGQAIAHPGVEARPYAKPTLEETQDEIRQILGQQFKASIIAGLHEIEVIK